MVTMDQAVARASEWLGVAPESVGSHEFELGWVVWEVPDDDADDVLSMLIGSAMGVVARDGSITSWPSLPVEVVAQRYADWAASRGRFSDDVEEGLYAAGWFPGRSVGDHAHGWLEDLLKQTDPDGTHLSLHDRARAFADEFGRTLLVQQLDEKHKKLLRLYPIAFEALPTRDWRPDPASATRLREAGLEGLPCPVGVYQEDAELEDVLLDDQGALYAVGRAVRRIGQDCDGSIAAFLTSAPWTELDADTPERSTRAGAKKGANTKRGTTSAKGTR